MEPKDVTKIPTMEAFFQLRDSLNLSDRQRIVFEMKYSRLMRNIDIAEELKVNQDTIGNDLRVIREKLAAISQAS